MHEGRPSLTAQHVAAARLHFERLAAPYGDPRADEALGRDVAAEIPASASERMLRYLQARTTFFDRTVVNALEREVTQVVVLGAGYDGRSLRYARPGVRWFEVDHPDTQHDKQARMERLHIVPAGVVFVPFDLRTHGLAEAIRAAGFEPDAPAQIVCEGVAVCLEPPVLELTLAELRALATTGTRLAISLRVDPGAGKPAREQAQAQARFRRAVAEAGEPARSSYTAAAAQGLFERARWRAVELSERAQRAGFAVAAPEWVAPAASSTGPPTAGRVGTFFEGVFDRSGLERLPGHLEAVYGIEVRRTRRLDAGVLCVERRDGPPWVARVFASGRPLEAVRADADVLDALRRHGYPAERCAQEDPVSELDGQAVLVTGFEASRSPERGTESLRRLGTLLGRLQSLDLDTPAAARPGGAWHHLVPEGGGPVQEVAAARELLRAAAARVPGHHRSGYEDLDAALAGAEIGSGLPEALVHPDFVPANAIGAEPRLIDWAGAGRGPRTWTLAFLLWAAAIGGRNAAGGVRAAMAGYRSEIELEDDELARLPAMILVRPLVFTVWRLAAGALAPSRLGSELAQVRARAETIGRDAVD